ncbi:hypothetical protein IVG45_02735 [Methylomonas sp. LL1]|uniref:hypothetical protein n=1 Tax=Methylomonas sp. LL1 TaxID=2785785 RepID=UPI0018C3BDE6|nr:hypothetical protein [Methylomonas sp. LL1]QPK63914.1 hypothetical protein IVG45_02735 [Methylomonas sp. LL1]
MNKLSVKSLLSLGLLPMLVFVAMAQAADNPHAITKHDNPSTCSGCHISTPLLKDDNILVSKNLPDDLAQFRLDGVAMCASCHSPDAFHKVGLNVDFPVPADLPLNSDNQIICLTCHYVHGRLDSDRPQASFSFMDRLLNAERLSKSFLLRRNNSDGELCLTCHNPSQGLN